MDMTGLDNEILEDQSVFNEKSGMLIRDFIDRLKKPVCLIAHNGIAYDYPLLMAELSKVKIELSSLDSVFFIDSLKAMREILNNNPDRSNDR